MNTEGYSAAKLIGLLLAATGRIEITSISTGIQVLCPTEKGDVFASTPTTSDPPSEDRIEWCLTQVVEDLMKRGAGRRA